MLEDTTVHITDVSRWVGFMTAVFRVAEIDPGDDQECPFCEHEPSHWERDHAALPYCNHYERCPWLRLYEVNQDSKEMSRT